MPTLIFPEYLGPNREEVNHLLPLHGDMCKPFSQHIPLLPYKSD